MAMFLEELRESSSRGKAVAVRGVWGVDMALLIGRRIGFESIRCLVKSSRVEAMRGGAREKLEAWFRLSDATTK